MQTAKTRRARNLPVLAPFENGVRHFIAGEFVASSSAAAFETIDPATEQVLALVSEGGCEEVDRAAVAAQEGFASWSRTPVIERARILKSIGDEILARKDELALLESLDSGKPISEALSGDIPRGAYNFHFFAEYIKFLESEAYPVDDVALNYTLYQPVGVAGLITPWNFPFVQATWKAAPCLAFGNTCILKPAEQTPLTSTILAAIIERSELPKGAFNLVHGFGQNSAGQAISQNPEVQLISFTGETSTGRAIMADASPHLKRLSFELGGKGANIIFADADLSTALEGSLQAAFRNQGEVCLAGSRIFVQREIYDEFLRRFVAAASEIRLGDPQDPNTKMGPLISEEHLEKVSSYVELARKDGAKIWCGGRRSQDFTEGNFYLPTVITDIDFLHPVCREEIFGPVVTILPFETDEEALEYTNSTPYGLSCSLWTANITRAHRLAALVQAGTVWVNCWFVRDLRVPYGGMKKSGIGREGGRHSMEFYTDAKTICLKL
jgi:aminomuconate-semialdehyde/2-hydroxymuconate-6-semialdehyde dehydrogenase